MSRTGQHMTVQHISSTHLQNRSLPIHMNENHCLSEWEPVRINQIMWECEWLNENVCDRVRYWWIMVSLLLRSRNQPAGFTQSCTIITLLLEEFSWQCVLLSTECTECRIKCTKVHKTVHRDPDHFTLWATPWDTEWTCNTRILPAKLLCGIFSCGASVSSSLIELNNIPHEGWLEI